MTAAPPTRPSSQNRRALAIAIGILVVLLAIAAVLLGGGPGGPGRPGATAGAGGDAARATRSDIVRALGSQGLQAEDATRPYRPAEAATLAGARRSVVRAIMPADPDHGFIVIYELDNPAAAQAAAEEQAAYVASGVGRVQFPNDTQFVIRVAGSTVVFFAWVPTGQPGSDVSRIAEALGTVGVGVPVPG